MDSQLISLPRASYLSGGVEDRQRRQGLDVLHAEKQSLPEIIPSSAEYFCGWEMLDLVLLS